MADLSTDPEMAEWWVHTVTVKPRLGSNAYIDRFDEPVPVRCFVEDDVKLVRDTDGNEVVSSTTIRADLAQAALFPVGSLVTTPAGREARVISLSRHDTGGLGGPDHLEAHLS